MKSKGLVLSIALVMLALGTLSAALTDRAVAEPAAPNTITIDTCTETNFDNALASANDGDVIDVRCATTFPAAPGAITFSAQKTISKSITIIGTHPIASVNRLSGGDATSLFWVNAGKTLTLTDITLERGHSAGGGGCLNVFGSLVALTTTLQHCHSTPFFILPGSGGAIYAYGANLTLTNTIFYSNTAEDSGGGLYVYSSTVSINQARFDSNLADNNGGGFYQQLGSAHFAATTLTSNTARYRGGGLYVTEVPTFYLQSDSRVEFNRTIDLTDSLGGGAYFTDSLAYIDHTAFIRNRVEKDGGGLYLESGAAIIDDLTFDGNVSSGSGGGIALHHAKLNLSNATLKRNSAKTIGGGLEAAQSDLELNGVTISDQDSGAYGGAGIACEECRGTWQNMTVSHNTSQRQGGGLYAYLAGLKIQNSTFDGNESNLGGGIYNNGRLQLINVTLSGNHAITSGGGIYNIPAPSPVALSAGGIDKVSAGTPAVITLTNVTLKDNGALQGGGFFNVNVADTHVYLKNTVLADSGAGGNCGGKTFDSAQYSLSSDLTCALSGTGNKNGVAAKLSPLSFVGGPTQVHLPLPDSPVVDMVEGSDYPPTDQRGVIRLQGLGADAGSVERQANDPIYGLLVYLPLVIK